MTTLSTLSPLSPFADISPLPPSYDLSQTLRVLGLNSPQAFRQSGLDLLIKSVPASGMKLYEAQSVQETARRLARLRIMQAWGERKRRGVSGRIITALKELSGSERDMECPKCHGFAIRSLTAPQTIRCLQGHETQLVPPRPKPRSS